MAEEVRRISLGEGQPDIIVEKFDVGDIVVKQPVYIRSHAYISLNTSVENLDEQIEMIKKCHPCFIMGNNTLTLEIP